MITSKEMCKHFRGLGVCKQIKQDVLSAETLEGNAHEESLQQCILIHAHLCMRIGDIRHSAERYCNLHVCVLLTTLLLF